MQPEMPVCKYSLLAGGRNGSAAVSLNLGDIIYHQWDCSEQKGDFYCMLLHTCTVDSGQGNMQTIIDEDGLVVALSVTVLSLLC
ncbi:unnamed protein product [Anisakis simplex]|uniref:ZP domain-containing protein n=1 Tax=Anisakis simplex TaxID=6269 RepID=A0A0M3JBM4_ANISI|nr:unnamed protein product [Anisakis simplex]